MSEEKKSPEAPQQAMDLIVNGLYKLECMAQTLQKGIQEFRLALTWQVPPEPPVAGVVELEKQIEKLEEDVAKAVDSAKVNVTG